mgnify:CR=1 FL=1
MQGDPEVRRPPRWLRSPRKLALGLLVFLVAHACRADGIDDRFLKATGMNDKHAHFLAGVLMGSLLPLEAVITEKDDKDAYLVIGAGFVACGFVGMLKEEIDHAKGGAWDQEDFKATYLGCAAGAGAMIALEVRF